MEKKLATPLKDAIKKWEENNGMKINEAKEIKLHGVMPPIDRIDNSLGQCPKCEFLSLSTNAIEKISNLGGMSNVKIVSLGRNNIKKVEQLDSLANSLEQLWLSYNQIEKTAGLSSLKKLKVLYMSNNKIKDWSEIDKLTDLPALEELLLIGNPLEVKHKEEGNWRSEVLKRLPLLKKLDGSVVNDDERPEGTVIKSNGDEEEA
eukprot:GCRY01003300.1.p1 GENE.GCRY01003300.1~~GCRY01003300.1.p1  ORF type:complete len:204 (-),score=50.43 GCRY01003300.1:201-812(-)